MNAALHNHSINANRNPVGTVVRAAFYYWYWFSRSRA